MPNRPSSLAPGRLKAKSAELDQALTGVLKPHHRFLLSEQLMHIDTLDEAIRRVSQEIEMRMAEEEISQPDSAKINVFLTISQPFHY